jgi:hypothetical protein
MKLTLRGHPTAGEAVAYLDSHCCRGELAELVVDEALSRLPPADAARLLAEAAARVAPGGTLVVRDLAVAAAAAMVAAADLDEAVLTDRRSFWTAAAVGRHLPGDFIPATRRVSGGGFEATFMRAA